MKRIILLLLLFSNYLTAQQWQPTSIRQRFVNGIGIPTRDTLPGALSDSSQLVLRPQDSIVYYKYKGYWRALGGGAAAFTSTLQHEVKAGEAITKGQAVYVTSADGTNMIVSKASNATEATSSKTLGLIASSLATNGKGYVITEGLLSGLNTSAATAGDAVWLGTGGNLVYGLANKPTAPAHLVFIGIVTRSNSSNGEIFVKAQNGFELNEIHDVAINSPRNQSILLYDSVAKLWRDTLASVITANKVNYTDTAAMLSPYLRSNVAASTYEPKITAGTTAQYWRGDKSWQTLPVYTLAGLGGQPQLNGTGFVKASGTTISYDNSSYYLASNPSGYTSNTGTVTSIATTAPLTGGTITTSGTLGITQATTSTSGFLSSTDWNTFNGKQNAITNPTTGTGTTNYVTKWTGASTLGNSLIYDNGTNIGIGTTSPLSNATFIINKSESASVSAVAPALRISNNGGGFVTKIMLSDNSRGDAYITHIAGSALDATTRFLGFGVDAYNQMILNASGNVGIGTTSPSELLHLQSSQPVIRYTKTGVLNWKAGLITGNDYAITADNIATTALTIQSGTGNVGIGTTSPSEKLSVTGNIYQTGNTYRIKNNSSNASYIRAEENTTTAAYTYVAMDGRSAGYYAISTNDIERLRITSSGNVGIGTASPAEKLSVAGRLLVNTNTTDGANALQVNGSAKISSLAGTGERLVAADASGKLVVSATAATVISGTYTPTATSAVNATSITIYSSPYTQIGNVVTVTVSGQFTPTAGNTYSKFNLNLPVQAISQGSAVLYGVGNISRSDVTLLNTSAKIIQTTGTNMGFNIESFPNTISNIIYFSANIQYTLQ